MLRTYQELILLPTFEERYQYLRLNGVPTEVTFGGNRLINQILYSSPEWKEIRRKVIRRDNGCDLGITDRPITKPNRILIHHINPLTLEQISNLEPPVFDLNNLICVSHTTHNAIHYGDDGLLVPTEPTVRSPGDTKLW